MSKKSSGSGTVKKSGGGSGKSINREGSNKSPDSGKRSYSPTPPKPKRDGGGKK